MRGPLPRALGGPLAVVYGAAVARRNRRYDAGVGVTRLGVPVVSVGNLSVGGTGKTPMVLHLVRMLLDAGRRPCVALRGYAPRGGERGAGSDEARVYEGALRGLAAGRGGGGGGWRPPVVADPDRAGAIGWLLGSGAADGVDCVVLDDGFQHRRLARDLDVVLIDASRDPFRDRLLPAGWLREPVTALGRAGAVVITHCEMVRAEAVDAIEGGARVFAGPDTPVARARHVWSGVRITPKMRDEGVEDAPGTLAESVREPAILRGVPVVAVCAIGNPEGFLTALRGAGASVRAAIVLRDHDPYRARTVGRVLEAVTSTGAGTLVTTEKDWAKLRTAADWPGVCAVARPVLELRFDRGERELLKAVLDAASGGPGGDPRGGAAPTAPP